MVAINHRTAECMNKHVAMVLGFWHTYYHACWSTWKSFQNITQPAFNALFPGTPWYNTPKLYQIVCIYNLTVAFDECNDAFKQLVDTHPLHRGLQYFWDFFNIVLPTLNDYSLALKSQNLTTTCNTLVVMQVLFEYYNNTSPSSSYRILEANSTPTVYNDTTFKKALKKAFHLHLFIGTLVYNTTQTLAQPKHFSSAYSFSFPKPARILLLASRSQCVR